MRNKASVVTLLWSCVMVAAMSAYMWRTYVLGADNAGIDVSVYYSSVKALLAGENPYALGIDGNVAGTPFTYPPFALLVFVPLLAAVSNILSAHFVMTCVTGVAVAFVMWQIVELIFSRGGGLPLRIGALTILGALTLHNDIFLWNFRLGQASVLILCLCLIDLLVLRNSRWSGALIGVAAGIKIIPAIFLLAFLIGRQWRKASTTLIVGAGSIVFGALVFPQLTWNYFTEYLWDVSRVSPDIANDRNVSVAGYIATTFPQFDYPKIGVLVGLFIFVLVAYAVRNLWAHAAVLSLAAPMLALASVLVSPVTWFHYALPMFIIPPVIVFLAWTVCSGLDRWVWAFGGVVLMGLVSIFGAPGLIGVGVLPRALQGAVYDLIALELILGVAFLWVLARSLRGVDCDELRDRTSSCVESLS